MFSFEEHAREFEGVGGPPQACLVSQWLRYALGVDRTGVDATQTEPILQAFIDSDKNLRELVVELTRSPAFRTHQTAL